MRRTVYCVYSYKIEKLPHSLVTSQDDWQARREDSREFFYQQEQEQTSQPMEYKKRDGEHKLNQYTGLNLRREIDMER